MQDNIAISKVVIFSWLFFFYCFFALVISIILLVIGDYFKGQKKFSLFKACRFLTLIFLSPLVISLLAWIDARFIEPNWIEVKHVTIKSDKFNDSLSQIKFVQISDLHIERFGYRERALIANINRIKPDIIFFTGDLVNTKKDLPVALEVLRQLHANKGIYAILGNNDYYFVNESHLINNLKEMGIVTLRYDNLKLDLGENNRLWLIGISDKYAEFANYGQISYVSEAFSGVPVDEPKVLLLHDPNEAGLSIVGEHEPQLILAGHTHGGQFGISFLRKYSDYAERSKYMAGLFDVNGVPLYVNRGIGMNTRPIRFFCRPEITVFTFRSK
ncbi:MAG: metallophosphoesterase [Candidatus Omnitrophica bacterium]|nr:metallophosphoesterase [Candidatus Omnitrophota bacterium]